MSLLCLVKRHILKDGVTAFAFGFLSHGQEGPVSVEQEAAPRSQGIWGDAGPPKWDRRDPERREGLGGSPVDGVHRFH